MQSVFFHTLFEAYIARCSLNSSFGRAQKKLGTANLAVFA